MSVTDATQCTNKGILCPKSANFIYIIEEVPSDLDGLVEAY
jgi:hypothetical protein